MSGKPCTLHLNLSGIRVQLDGPDDGVLTMFREEWAPWLASPVDRPDLVVEYSVSGDPPPDQALLNKVLHTVRIENGISFTTGEGRVDLDSAGRAAAVVRKGGDRFRFFGLQNLLLAALARVIPGRGFLVVHGAGILLNGIAVALIGPEGSGKTTWARIAEQHGARVLSDDLLFLGLDGGQAIALGSPFRGAANMPGRYRLGMALRAVHAQTPSILPGSRLAFLALLSANLPYSGDRIGNDPRLDGLLDSFLDAVPFRTLAFAKSPSFLPLLEDALAGGRNG